MNKLEKYSLHSALQPSRPTLNECFFPIKNGSYISYNIDRSSTSRFYFHWQEVVDLINPYLQKEGVSIIKIGDANSPQLHGTLNYSGKTFNQDLYILKRSMLHFNAFDYFSYLCDFYEKPNVSLFSSTNSSKEKFLKPDIKKFIDSPKLGKNPSLIDQENPKTIDNICPVNVAHNILNLLGIKNELGGYKMIHFGASSHLKMVEVIPDFKCQSNFYPKSIINIRADLHHDESLIGSFCSDKRKIGLITKKSLSQNFLYKFRSYLNKVVIYVDDSIDNDFILNLKKFNINYQLVCINESSISNLRCLHIDEDIELWEPPKKKDLDISEDICNNLFFNTSKVMHSKSGKFNSKAHWVTGEQQEVLSKVIDVADFWEDSDFYYIYEKNR